MSRTLKEQLKQRFDDLRGSSTEGKRGELIENTALMLLHRDLLVCGEIARDVVSGSGQTDPDVSDVLAIHQLYQAYLGPSYQWLVTNGDIPQPPPPPVPTNNSGAVRTKDQLDS